MVRTRISNKRNGVSSNQDFLPSRKKLVVLRASARHKRTPVKMVSSMNRLVSGRLNGGKIPRAKQFMPQRKH